MSRIGEKIKTARMEQNISLKHLAKKCGVAESYIADVESGRRVLNDSMIKTLSQALNINLNEPLFIEDDLTDEVEAERKPAKAPMPGAVRAAAPAVEPTAEWQSAFSRILKDVPVYNMNMDNILRYIPLPIIDKKVEGHNPDKLIYVAVSDNSMGGFRIKKDDLVMVLLNPELSGEGLYLIELNGVKAIRQIKKLDGSNVLIVSHSGDIKTQAVDIHDIKVMGRCIKAEINLWAPNK